MSIKKAKDAAKEQVRYREEQLKKMIVHIDQKINEHLGKYSDDDGLHKIRIPMTDSLADFPWFWEEGLREAIEASVAAGGWKIPTSPEKNPTTQVVKDVYQLQPLNGAISIHLLLEASEEELEELDKIREDEHIEFHRVNSMRKKHGV